MSQPLLSIQGLKAQIDDKPILTGLNLSIPPGELHVIMGPNGSGKSTLAHTIMGHPNYKVTGGSIALDGENLEDLSTTERARKGVFLAFQYPLEVSGVAMAHFLWNAYQAVAKARGEDVNPKKVVPFRKGLSKSLDQLKMGKEFATRHLNVGASGGEKKRLEVAQMLALKPKLAILDEIDSGLDIDSTRVVAQNINDARRDDLSILIITHYPRILEDLQPDRIHVMAGGRIMCSRGMELARELEEKGYDWLLKEYDENREESA